MTTRKLCLFFLAATVASGAEQALIDRLAVRYDVHVRNGGGPSLLYGARLEAADAVAGTLPSAVSTAIADYPDGDVTPAVVSKPESILILPSTGASVAAAGGTLQLRLVKADRNETTDAVTLTDITSGAESAWSSGTPAKATIDADTGVVTGAAGGAGSTVITATVTYDTDKTMTTTRTITVT